MKQLSTSLGECVCLAVEQDYTVVYVHVADGPGQMLRTTQRIGSQAPMHCTGVGKVILSEFPESKIDEMIRMKGLTRYTDNTLVTREMLLGELQLIRKRGYAYDNERVRTGRPVYRLSVKRLQREKLLPIECYRPSWPDDGRIY